MFNENDFLEEPKNKYMALCFILSVFLYRIASSFLTVYVAHEVKLNNYKEGNYNIHFFYDIKFLLKRNPGMFEVD